MMGSSVRALIDKRACETPDAVFLIDPNTGETVSYQELKQAAQAIAANITAKGAQSGDSVAYAMNNGIDAALVVLGILYGGFLATAINLVSGRKVIAYVLKHSEARLVYCQREKVPIVEEAIADGLEAELCCVDSSFFSSTVDQAIIQPVNQNSDGLLMYTSGTTGLPKGVVLSHGNLVAGGQNAAIAHELTPEDRGLCVLPLYHINGLCVTILGALVSGGGVILPKKFSVSKFWEMLGNHDGTWFSVVPTQISYLLLEAETNGTPKGNEKIRFGRSASAPLAPEVHKAFEERFSVPIVETMGLTETAAQILSNPLPPGKRKIGSPGRAIGNQIQIADDHQNELPRGKEGEILVRGPNVMRGYLKNPEATAQALTGEGWLCTGDLGRMDDDGYVFVTGRLKELIIKGGENIAPREIDDALYSHPDVVEAAAFARDCPRYGQKVEAGVMVKNGSPIKEEDLIEVCRQQVGTFKAPDRIYFFAELPKGPSGKIQRLKVSELTG